MNALVFSPPRQRGGLVLSVLIAALSTITAVAIWRASLSPIGPGLVIFILAAVIAFFPIPFLVYWLVALQRAGYSLDRDKLTLSWGLRVEQIPVSDVEWVRPAADLSPALPLPLVRLPGAVLGTRRHPEIGPIEFLASDDRTLLVVATARHVFAISPDDPAAFTQNVQRITEMGSLTPAASQSIYPSFVVALAWENLLARYLWMAGLFLNVGLLAWVSLMVPGLKRVALGFLPSGVPREVVPGVGLILLPIVSISVFLLGWVAGLFFYRRKEQRPLAHIVWAGGLFSTLLFLVAVMFILITPA